MEQQVEHLTQKDMLKEIMRDSKDQGKLIASMNAKLESFQALQKQQSEFQQQQSDFIIAKINSRMDAVDDRCERHKEIYEARQLENGRRMDEFDKRLKVAEGRPAEDALEKKNFISRTIIQGLGTLVFGIIMGIMGWIAHNYAIG